MPPSTGPDPSTAAVRSEASSPLCSGRTAVCAPIMGRMASAAASIWCVLVAKRTMSTGPTAAGSSVAWAGKVVKSPKTLSMRKPCSRMARRCSPRAMSVTSSPDFASNPPK